MQLVLVAVFLACKGSFLFLLPLCPRFPSSYCFSAYSPWIGAAASLESSHLQEDIYMKVNDDKSGGELKLLQIIQYSTPLLWSILQKCNTICQKTTLQEMDWFTLKLCFLFQNSSLSLILIRTAAYSCAENWDFLEKLLDFFPPIFKTLAVLIQILYFDLKALYFWHYILINCREDGLLPIRSHMPSVSVVFS